MLGALAEFLLLYYGPRGLLDSLCTREDRFGCMCAPMSTGVVVHLARDYFRQGEA